MKKVGIIGGAGPYASALFYETFIKESYELDHLIPEIFLLNYTFSRGLNVQEAARNEKALSKQLEHCIRMLEQNNVEIGVIACNTLHLYLEKIKYSPLQFLSLPETVMAQARNDGMKSLLILATQNSCRSSLYCNSNLTMIYPSDEEQSLVDAAIDRVLSGDILENDSELIARVIEQISARIDFDAVVLGCTDLPVLHDHYPLRTQKPLYDSIKLPAKILRRMV